MNREIMMTLGHVARVHRHSAGRLLEGRVSWGQPPVLRYLECHDGCIQRDIAENCHIKAASVSSVLDKMEQCGFISRQAQEDDRRVQRVYLTAEGKAKCELVNGMFRQLEERCLAGIGDRELGAFHKTLEKIFANMWEIGREEGFSDDQDSQKIHEGRGAAGAHGPHFHGRGGVHGHSPAHLYGRDH
jgi:DNA-binding MarR family transcriptional regulator